MLRSVKPEILDHLAPDDPAIPHARRDLLWINRLMGNHRWIRQQLRVHLQPGEDVVEWGGGDGALARSLRVDRSLSRGMRLTVIDQAPPPHDLPSSILWRQEDLLDPARPGKTGGIIIANLILHHFEQEQLTILGARIRREARVFVACEPVRRTRYRDHIKLLHVLRIHAVTRHDARVSIEAGFLGHELADWLGFAQAEWKIRITESFLGAYRLLAVRR